MLTRKQHELLMFIDRHLRSTGFSPSFEEMKEALDLKSKSGIHRLISALEERGFLQRRHHRARALHVVRLPGGDAPQAMDSLAAAPDIAAEEQRRAGRRRDAVRAQCHPRRFLRPGCRRCARRGRWARSNCRCMAASPRACRSRRCGKAPIEVPVALVAGGDHYALQVAGDSMQDAGILDGDTIIIRKGDVGRKRPDRGRPDRRQRGDAEASAPPRPTRSRWNRRTSTTRRRFFPPTASNCKAGWSLCCGGPSARPRPRRGTPRRSGRSCRPPHRLHRRPGSSRLARSGSAWT